MLFVLCKINNVMIDKQTNPGEEEQEEITAPEETSSEKEIATIAEHDADEAIHLANPKVSDENKQQDADDAVHKTVSPLNVAEELGKETDPDELVHGH